MAHAAIRTSSRPDARSGALLPMLAEVLLALRSPADLGTAAGIAGTCAVRALGGREHRLLRLDPKSGALLCVEESGPETPYLPDPGGPLEHALRRRVAVFDEGRGTAASREAALWSEPPGALATIPLLAGDQVQGALLVAFDVPRILSIEEQTSLRAVADALALALERIELRRALAQERTRAAELEREVLGDEEHSAHLMSVVAQEIRSPLTGIKAYAETLLDSLAHPNAPRERFLSIINDECDRLARLVADILDLSRLEAGRRPLRLARFDLDVLVAETIQTLMPVAHARQVTFDVDVERGTVVEGDPDLMRRLLVNLLGNSLHHSPRSGRIRIHVRADAELWTGVIEDQGPPIPAADLPHVFERLYRGRPSGTPESAGPGLGLAIARGVAEAHGGRVWAESLEPVGARLCVTVPMRQLASPRARRIARQITSQSGLEGLFEESIELIAAALDAQIVSLAMVDPEHGDLSIVASRGLDGFRLLGRRTTFRSGVTGSVAAWGRPLLVNNIETDRRFERLSNPQYRTKSLLCVPFRVRNEVLGVVNVTNKSSGEAFDAEDLATLLALAQRLGSALERAWAHPESGRVVEEALAAVRRMAALKREWLFGTRNRVRLARAVARDLGMSDSEIELIGHVAAMHEGAADDLGARGDHAADDSGRAAASRRGVSLDILRPSAWVARVRELILADRERWDGSGHPSGLRGEGIPLGSRVLSAVAAYTRLRHGTLFQPPLSRDEASAELRRAAGTEFDPRVVETLLEAVQGGEDAA